MVSFLFSFSFPEAKIKLPFDGIMLLNKFGG
jgi:hypothetical protein